MKTIVHKAETRGRSKQGWLESWFSFSFANYRNPERMQFGALRVLNDDIIDPGTGFDMHPHDNMEIVTIPIDGGLRHQDSTGGKGVINAGDVQIMSAGTGIVHSEFNASFELPAQTLQIWVFPEKYGIKPRYDQKTFDPAQRRNAWQTVVSPQAGGEALWINQQAYFSLVDLEKGKSLDYQVHQRGHGVYFFVVEGDVAIAEQSLARRDGLGVWEVESIPVKSKENAQVLAIEVPMG